MSTEESEEHIMKIVILEADSLGQDMVFTPFEALGEVVIYRSTTADEMEEKTKDADVIVANKVPICESTIGKAQNLKLVCLTATGFNNLDGDYLKRGELQLTMLPDTLQTEWHSIPSLFFSIFWKN